MIFHCIKDDFNERTHSTISHEVNIIIRRTLVHNDFQRKSSLKQIFVAL